MPPQTTLQFFRKRQTVASLLLERPQSLSSFYGAVEESLSHIETRLVQIQSAFFGSDGTVEDEITKWTPVLEYTMKFAKVADLISKAQLQEVIDQYNRSVGDHAMVVKFDKPSVRATIEVIDKVITYLSTGCSSIVEALTTILFFMRKYCLSFSGIDGDLCLETLTNYEKQRRELANAIQINLDDIGQMAERLEGTGVRLQELGSVPKQLAEKYGCKHIPLLVLFPGACENVRNACIGVRKWILADVNYPTFIQYDIQDLEQSRDKHSKAIRDLQLTVAHLENRIKVYSREITECEAELGRVAVKEQTLTRREEAVGRRRNQLDQDIEFSEIRREHLRNIEQTQEKQLQMGRMLTELEKLNAKRLIVDKNYKAIARTLRSLKIKRENKRQKETELEDVKEQHRSERKELRRKEIEKDRLELNIIKMKDVYRLKTSPEVLKKLFYNMPLPSVNAGVSKRRRKGASNSVDKLERVSRITAANIEGDWPKLYRELPFHPPRGDENIRMDIDEISRVFMRDNDETRARRAFARWRRMHTRARIEDVRKALLQLRRKDIADKIDDELARRARIVKEGNSTMAESCTRTVRFPRLPIQQQYSRSLLNSRHVLAR